MPYLDPVEWWIRDATGRTLDQHATDPIRAAAHLPETAERLRRARSELLLVVDALRTSLINGDDLTSPASTITTTLLDIAEKARDHLGALTTVDHLIGDCDRMAYAQANPGRTVRRRYVNPGDTAMIVLPHTDACRARQLAGKSVPVRITESDAELVAADPAGPTRVSHASAGIYHDPVAGGLYIVRTARVRTRR